ncbi:MAG: YwqG family protein [Ktedonobacteraceae bacterium]
METINVQNVQAALEQAGFKSLVPHLNVITRPAIHAASTPVEDATLHVGASKIGGLPDLAPGVEWPEWQGVPQSFVGQIRLEEVRQYDVEKVLPAQGLLTFFYNAKQDTYGEGVGDAGSWRIFFTEDTAHLKRTPTPQALPASSLFKASSLTFSSQLTLSAQPQLEVPGLPWTQADQQRYDPIFAQFGTDTSDTTPRHQLLGHPLTLQDDMRLQCETASQGITDNTNSPELASKALRWQLLFQIDNDERIGMQWASSGLLYYWMTREDLQARNFEGSWLVLQSE